MGKTAYEIYGSSYQIQHDRTQFGTQHVSHGKRPPHFQSFEKISQKVVLGDFNWHMNRSMEDPRSWWHSSSKRRVNMLFLDGHSELFTFPLTFGYGNPVDLDNNGWH
ncbi:MAG: hypothetical protein NE334_04460 [Lentisphaeraceae bacterium]|nr:hypothetical protein [Lentisphaeraceae bacterium]